MNKEDIVNKILYITNNECFLDYNVAEFGDSDIIQDSRLKSFAIVHKVEDSGIVIEYIKGKIYLSFFFNPKFADKIDYSEIISKMPIRFQEIIADIKRFKNNPISASQLERIIVTAIKGVPKHKIAYIDYVDSRYAILIFIISDIIINNKQHTYLYLNKPLFGKINTHFRASTKKRIPSIGEIIDTEKCPLIFSKNENKQH